jgi:predicted secreted protein
VTSSTGAVLTTIGEPVYTPSGAPTSGVGSGGVEAWSFVANRSGRREVRFEYRRPWEREAAAAKALSYTITVNEPFGSGNTH